MPRPRRPRYARHSSVRHLDPTEQSANPSATPDRASQPTTEFPLQQSIHSEFQRSTVAGPSSSSPNPCNRPLPLNWNRADSYVLSFLIHEYCFDFDDSVKWWERIVPFFTGKTAQELRLFTYLYLKAYGELPPNLGRFLDSNTENNSQFEVQTENVTQLEGDAVEVAQLEGNAEEVEPLKGDAEKNAHLEGDGEEVTQLEGEAEEVTQLKGDKEEADERETIPMMKYPEVSNQPRPSAQNRPASLEAQVVGKYFDWTLDESRTLMNLIEKKPSIMMSRGGWKLLASQFPGKKPSDIGRHIAMGQIAAAFMGELNDIPMIERLSLSSRQDEAVNSGDPEPSTSAQANDSEQATDVMLGMLREPQGQCPVDSPPSTSGRPPTTAWPRSPKASSSKSGQGRRHGSKRSSKR